MVRSEFGYAREYLDDRGSQNPSAFASGSALAWAKAIGCTRAGVIRQPFRDEPKLICLANKLYFVVDERGSFRAASIRW